MDRCSLRSDDSSIFLWFSYASRCSILLAISTPPEAVLYMDPPWLSRLMICARDPRLLHLEGEAAVATNTVDPFSLSVQMLERSVRDS